METFDLLFLLIIGAFFAFGILLLIYKKITIKDASEMEGTIRNINRFIGTITVSITQYGQHHHHQTFYNITNRHYAYHRVGDKVLVYGIKRRDGYKYKLKSTYYLIPYVCFTLAFILLFSFIFM